jgi:hypothetical protein
MTTLSINTLLENAKANNLSKETKALNLINNLIDEKTIITSSINPKNSTIEYYFKLDDTYTIKYQPYRDEIILKANDSNYLEVHSSKDKKGYRVCTRGMYLLKMSFTKKEEAFKNILLPNLSYHEKWDMKHQIDNLPLSMASKFIKKFWKLDNNATIKTNDFVKDGEDLDSKKSVYLKARVLEKEEEE